MEFLALDSRIQRLAFVQEWSDALLLRLLSAGEQRGLAVDELVGLAQKAAEDLNLSRLREGDHALALAAAHSFGFASVAEMEQFVEKHPLLMDEWLAEPALSECTGTVVAVALTQAVFSTADGKRFAFEKAQIQDIRVGDQVVVGKFGSVKRAG